MVRLFYTDYRTVLKYVWSYTQICIVCITHKFLGNNLITSSTRIETDRTRLHKSVKNALEIGLSGKHVTIQRWGILSTFIHKPQFT